VSEEVKVATTRKREPRLSDDDLTRVIALMKDSDSVELKLTVPESEHSPPVAALEMDPLDAQIRQVFFFDTPDLTLNEHGVVVRARRVQKKGDDSVVKLRPVVPSKLPACVRRKPEFGVEVDAMPGGFVCSGSMRGRRARTFGRPWPESARSGSCSRRRNGPSTPSTLRTASSSTT
jgi:hypothetical protein